MSSVDWLKLKGANDSKAKFWHCDEQKRLEHEHANKQIDKSRTHMNMAFGEFENGYDAVCTRYDEMIADLDAQEGANKRKDRVTCVGWSIPAPAGMSDAESRRWFAEVYDTLLAKYGDCMVGGSAHFDEVHTYKDAETGEARESRPHLHVYAVPIVDGRLNGKQFTSRRNMVEMNNAIERMTAEYFPSYKFMDGSKRKSRKSVEELKNESALREAVEQAKEQAQQIVADAQRYAEDAQKRSERVLSDANDEARQITAKARKASQIERESLTRQREDLDAREVRLSEREAEVEKREREIMNAPIRATKRVIEVVQRTNGYKTGTPDGNALGRFKMFVDRYGDRITEQIHRDAEQRLRRVASYDAPRVQDSKGYTKE